MAKAKPRKKRNSLEGSELQGEMLEQLNKKGKRIKEVEMMPLTDPSKPLTVKDTLSTGLPNLDKNLCMSVNGKWGLPVGKIISIKSKPAVGKTSLLLSIADQAYRRGGAVHIVESEHALDMNYARKICPAIEQFFITQPDTLETAFDAIEGAIDICFKARKRTGTDAPFVILVDSFSGFTTEAELAGDFSTSGKALGEHARIASLACRKLTGPIAKSKVILILSHQPKAKLGTFWGSPETNIGGDAFNYHDSICIKLYRTASIKDSNKVIIGHYGVATTTKNKLFPPHRDARTKIINGKGFNKNFAILDFMIGEKKIIKKGSWFKFKEDPSLCWQGIGEFNSFLKNNRKAVFLIKKYLRTI